MTRRSAVIVSTTVEDELVPALPLSTLSAVEMLHDSALYKFMIDIDIDIDIDITKAAWATKYPLSTHI